MGVSTPTRARPRDDDAPKPREQRPRVRPRSLHRVDVVVLVGSAVSSLCLIWLMYFRLLPFSGAQGFVLLWFATFIGFVFAATRELQGTKAAVDRAITAAISVVSLSLVAILAIVIGYVIVRGLQALTPAFFSETMGSVGPLDPASEGGAFHALIGTFEQVALAMLLSVPLGVLTAVFLNEVRGPLTRPVRTFVDAMSGVPSIVAGLFIFTTIVSGLNWGFSGFAAALALAILMLPSITRTTEVVLRLVPDGLREGALALGAPEWRSVTGVVLPTARSGIVTAVILGVARGVGETAPLILTAFGADVVNWNPFTGPQSALPLYVWKYYKYPDEASISRAWTGALLLMTVVLVLFLLARLIGSNRTARKQARAARRISADNRVAEGGAG